GPPRARPGDQRDLEGVHGRAARGTPARRRRRAAGSVGEGVRVGPGVLPPRTGNPHESSRLSPGAQPRALHRARHQAPALRCLRRARLPYRPVTGHPPAHPLGAMGPQINIVGSFFPSWMLCALIGIVTALLARRLFIRAGLDPYMGPPPLVYASLLVLVALRLWLGFFYR